MGKPILRNTATSFPIKSALASMAVALLSNCGVLSPEPAPRSIEAGVLGPAIRPEAQHYGNDSFIYTAQLYGNDLKVYKRSGTKLAYVETLTSGIAAPAGTVATVNGWWYVANGGDSNVVIYQTGKSGPTGPVGQLDDSGQDPVNVAVTPNRRFVAVSNYGSASESGSVSVYLNRATEPTRLLSYGSAVQGAGVAIDHQGNCFWAFNDLSSNSGSVVEFARCSGKGSVVISGIPKAGGIVFDQSGDLYYVNEITSGSLYSGIWRCSKTSACQLFTPMGAFGEPTNLNFDYKAKELWAADATGYIDEVDPKTGSVTKISADGGATDPPVGIAPEPGQ